jgi:4-amino-4-deoxy-L-arabinose transferase-like glycosyltransferase
MKWQATYKREGKGYIILVALMVLKVVLQYVLIHPSFDLHRDEFLHLDQANHLAWGYISVPPFTSWVAWIIKALGNDPFWVRFFPAFAGALTVWAAWKIAEELGGSLFAKVMVAVALVFSVILRLNTLFQPNSFEILFWTLFYLFLIRYVKHGRPPDVYAAAVALALSFLTKYNVLFMGAGLAAAILLSPQRRLLLSRHVWFAALLFVLMILPNLVWQYQNGIPFIRHMQELSRTQLVNMSRAIFVKEQLLFFLNSIFLLVLAVISVFRFPPFRPYRFILAGSLLTMVLYVYFRAKGYYTLGLYPVILAFGAVYLESLTVKRKIWRYVAVVASLLVFLPFVRLAFPYITAEEMAENQSVYREVGLLRWEDGKDHHLQQDFADMLGWRELAYKVDSAVNMLGGPENVLVLANNYGQAGAINYYSINKLQSVSFNADYLDWFPVGKPIRHVIRIMEIDDDDDDPERWQERSLCDTLFLAGEIEHELARERGTKIWVMKNVKGDLWPLLQQEINEHKRY